MNTFANRVRSRRKALGLSQSELAKRCGLSQVTISDIERERNDASREIVGLARALQCTPEWLATGEGPMEGITQVHSSVIQLVPNALPLRRPMGQSVPLLATVPAGNWREVVDAYAMGGADNYVMALEDVGAHGFALRVVGNSMEPEFHEGEVVFVNPDRQPKPGDFVVARNHKLECTLKKYRPRGLNERGEDYYELVPLNEDYPTLRSDFMALEIIGVVVELRRVF
jgi:SOS-response transcriptional repressor LexA